MFVQKSAKHAWGSAPRPRRTGTPARNGCAVPDRRLNGAYKVPRAHFIAAAPERRTANHHPCPLLKGGGLWGKAANTLRSAARLSAGHSPAPQPPRPVLPASPDIPRVCLSVYGGPLILRFAWCGRAMRFCAPAMLRPAGGYTAASSQTAGHSRRPAPR